MITKSFELVEQKFEEEHGLDLYDDLNAVQDLREKAEACKKCYHLVKIGYYTFISRAYSKSRSDKRKI